MENNKDYNTEFMDLFNNISSLFILDKYSEELVPEGKILNADALSPLWDLLEDIKDYEYINIGNKKYVKRKYFFKKPVRILFSILLAELERRLYRAIEYKQGKINLDNKNLNDLIRLFLKKDYLSLQKEYNSRSSLKNDLKALSSFRNIIVHVNKRLEESTDYQTLVERKTQILRLLNALQQITDNLKQSK